MTKPTCIKWSAVIQALLMMAIATLQGTLLIAYGGLSAYFGWAWLIVSNLLLLADIIAALWRKI